MSPRSLRTLPALAGAALAASALANTVSYQISGNAVVVVADGGLADLDPAPDRIKFTINSNGSIGGATFHVSATVIAQADPPVSGKPVLTFSSLTITNTGGQVNGGTMWVRHTFAPIDKPSLWTARIAGRFDSTVTPGALGGSCSLNHSSQVFSSVGGWKSVVNKNTGLVFGAAPIPFVLAGGPVGWKIASKQQTDLVFYLDSPGDSIFVTPADNSRFYVALVPLLFCPRRRPA